MKAHLHSHPLPLIEESPQISQRTSDIVGLIEKKLSTIESSFQRLDDRISRIETREARVSSLSPMKYDDNHRYGNKPNNNDLLDYKSEVNKRLLGLEQKLSNPPISTHKPSNTEKLERGIKEHQLAIDNLYDRVKKLQELSHGQKPSQNRFTEEVIDIVKKHFGAELQGLTKMVRSIQESQIYLESEFNAIRKSQPAILETDRFNGRLSNSKHHNQSPLKVKFEREPTDSEEERFSHKRQYGDTYAQASPYSPPKTKHHSSNYKDIDTNTRVHTDGDYSNNREDSRSNTLNKYKNNKYTDKKYEQLQTEPASRENDVRPDLLYKNITTSSSGQKNRQQSFEESLNKDWRTPGTQSQKKNSFLETQYPVEPPKILPDYPKSDTQESRSSSVLLKHEKPKATLGSQEAAILQSKQKIREDIDNLKRLVIRENEERSVSRERLKSSGEKASQSGDERRLIKLQSAMPKQEATQPFEWRVSDETEIMRDASSNSRQSSHRDYGGSLAKNDNLRKEADQSRQNVSASKTRSTSMYDARPLTQGSKPERKESQLTPEQKQQIDLEIQRKIQEETERRKRQNISRRSFGQTVENSRNEFAESNDENTNARTYARARNPTSFEDQRSYQFAK